jgi:hypothetical protein
VPVVEVTLGIPALLVGDGAIDVGPGLYLSSEVADSLDVKTNERIPGSNAFVAQVFSYPDDGRTQTLRFAALVVADDVGVFDECWIQTRSSYEADRDFVSLAKSIDFPPDTEVVLRQLNSTLGLEFDTLAAFEERPTRFGSLIVGLGTFALGLTWVFLRRLELASNQQAGLDSMTQQLQIVVEAFGLWLLAALIAGLSALLHPLAASELSYVLTEFSINIASAAIGFISGAITYHASISRRSIYRFFKER